jgi:hypothetical protein
MAVVINMMSRFFLSSQVIFEQRSTLVDLAQQKHNNFTKSFSPAAF